MEDEEEEAVAAAEAERRRYGDKMLLCDIGGWRPGSETTPDPGAVAAKYEQRHTHLPPTRIPKVCTSSFCFLKQKYQMSGYDFTR